jgi:hypothetical protein
MSQVDVFATGVLAYFMLYRALPFWSDNHEDILNKTRACEVRNFWVDGPF